MPSPRPDDSPGWPCRTAGRPHLPPLLLLHGFLGRGDDWLPLVAQLSGHFFCLLPDLPGHGRHPPQSSLNFDAAADGLARLLHQHHAAPAHLLGYSLGGRLALVFALKYPALVQKLALEGASPGLSAPAERQARAALDDDRAAALRRHGLEPFVANWYQAGLFASLAARPELLANTLQRRQKNNAGWLADAISAFSPGRQPNLWPRLGEISMPALLLAGEQDAKFTGIARQMAQGMPHAQVAIVPQAGHNVHLEQPAAFTAQVQQFLAEA